MTDLNRMLDLLPGTAKSVADDLGLTPGGVRYHLEPLVALGTVTCELAPPTGKAGRRKKVYALVGDRPKTMPAKECLCCERLKDASEFFLGREGPSLCCKQCYADRPQEVANLRRRNDSLKAHARRAKTFTGDRTLIAEYAKIIGRDPCAYCGGPMSVIDHIEPLSGCGLHDWENLTPACSKCNSRKSARPLLDFLSDVVQSR